MKADKNNDWENLKERLAKYAPKWQNTNFEASVTSMIPRTALLGNGDLGIVSSGSFGEKEYLICKGDFWNCGDMHTDCVREADPRRVSILAVGGIKIRMKDMSVTENEETLSIENGILTTCFKGEEGSVSMTAWVEQEENLFFVKLFGEKLAGKKAEAELWVHGEEPKLPASSGVGEHTIWCTRRSSNEAPEEEGSWLSEVFLSAKTLSRTEETSVVSGHSAKMSVTFDEKGEAYIIAAVSGGGRTYDNKGRLQMELPQAQGETLLNQISSKEDIVKKYGKSEDWWKEYWLKSYIEIHDFELERYYYGSLYYMGAGTREGKLPPGLYGIWATTDGAMWNGDYHLNYNMIAPFYGMYSANRCEFAKSVKEPLLDYMEQGKKRAKEDLSRIFPAYISGGRGTEESETVFPGRPDLENGIEDAVLYPVALGPWGSTAWNENGAYLMQVNNAGFSAQALTAYYAYTQDAEYIREIYPFLEQNINFYLKWCEKEVLESGDYRYNVWSGAHEETFDKNSTNSIGVIRNILECLFQAAEKGHINPEKEKSEKWTDLYEHLADYHTEVWSDGNGFAEEVIPLSEKGIKYSEGSATVNLEFVHPGEGLTFDSEPDFIKTVQNTIRQKELLDSQVWDQVNNTVKMYTHAIRAGFDPEYIMKKFREHLQKYSQKNFTIKDGNHGIEKAGAIEFINSMLLQSAGEIIKVFPVWPAEKNAGFVRLRAKGAYLVSSGIEEGKVKYVDIVSEKGAPVTLVCPWEKAKVKDDCGNKVEVKYGHTRNTGETTIFFEANPGVNYHIRCSE